MATALADGVWWLDLGMVNAYLVDAGEVVLVDAGTPGKAEDLRAGVAAAGYSLGEVARVLVTHYDVDHVGGLARLDDELAATVHAPRPDADYLAGEDAPSPTTLKGLFQRLAGLAIGVPDLSVEPVEDGDIVAGFTAVRTPGHTSGHTTYVDEAAGVGALGDLVHESGGRLRVPQWYLNRDTAAVRESIRRLADRAPPFDVAAPGHGEPLVEGGRAALEALASSLE